MELVDFDVCKPMRIKSMVRVTYFITLVDDTSRKVWAYSIKQKDDILDIFKNFHTNVEKIK